MGFRPHEAPVDHSPVDGYTVSARGQRIEIAADPDLPPLRLVLHASTGRFVFDDQAIRDVRYLVEERRGYDHAGPLWSPGRFRADLTRRAPITVIASAESWDTIAATNPDGSTTVSVLASVSGCGVTAGVRLPHIIPAAMMIAIIATRGAHEWNSHPNQLARAGKASMICAASASFSSTRTIRVTT